MKKTLTFECGKKLNKNDPKHKDYKPIENKKEGLKDVSKK